MSVRPKSSSSRRKSVTSSKERKSIRAIKEAANNKGGKAFLQTLTPEALEYFNEVARKPFSAQATAFLNAYWSEVGDQAEFIFSVAWETMKYADMHCKGVSLIHLYEEGNMVDFNIGLYFYEKLCKKVLDDKDGRKWRNDDRYKPSLPEMMTAIVRKQELRDKVDVNFDGRVSFLEYLLYQYRDFANPAEFTERAMKAETFEEHPEIVKAKSALDAVNAAIQAYEKEKARLEEGSKLAGVKGLTFKHQLTMLVSSPLAETLGVALIKAEAAVRMAQRKLQLHALSSGAVDEYGRPTQGTLWWLNRDLEAKKARYGERK